MQRELINNTLLFFQLSYDVYHGAVAPFHYAYYSVGGGYWVGGAGHFSGARGELVHRDDGEALDFADGVEQVFAARVDRYAVFGDDGVDYLAGGRDAVDLVGDAGDASAEQRLSYYRELRAGRGVLVSAGAVEQSAVGFGVDVRVEVGVDFGRAEDYDVEHVDRRAAVPRVRVPVGGDFYVVRVFGYRAHGVEVEGLHVHELPEQPFFEQLDEVARDAAEAEAALYSLTYHRLLYKGGDGERYAARAGLERYAVFEVWARLDELRRVFRYEQAQRVARDLRRAGDDARGVAYRRHFDDDVGLGLRYRDGRCGVGDEVVGDGYHGVGVVGVGVGVAERAAGGFAYRAADVAAAVGCRRGDEGDVDVYVARHDGARASAVAAQDDGNVHAAFGDELAYRSVDGAHYFCDDAAFYVFDDFFMYAE